MNIPEGLWLAPPQGRQGTFELDAEINEAAALHYEGAPALEGEQRRLGSFVHLGHNPSHIDIMPNEGGWAFHAHRLGKAMDLGQVTAATRAVLLNADPEADPMTKGVQALSGTVKLHPAQLRLLGEGIDDSIAYEDGHVLAINKPSDVGSHWDGSHHVGVKEIAQKWRGEEVDNAHRIDRLTTGVLVLGKTATAARALTKQFARGTDQDPEKIYLALVEGDLDSDLSIRCFLDRGNSSVNVSMVARGGKIAKTTVTKIGEISTGGRTQSLLGVQIMTGRTHQIRASLAAIGMPIVGDPIYGRRAPDGRMRLHASSVTITHPESGERLKITAPLPEDFITGLGADERQAYADHAAGTLSGYDVAAPVLL